MGAEHVYELDWNGTGSDAFFTVACLFFCGLVTWSVLTIVRAIKDLRRHPDRRGEWGAAGAVLLKLIILIGLEVVAALAESGAGWGVSTGYSSRVKPGSGKWLGVALLIAPVLPIMIVQNVFFEQPLRISVSPRSLKLLYRLPWRDRSIPMSNVRQVELRRRNYLYRGTIHQHYYALVISHDGITTRVVGSQRPWYESQMKEAYEDIQKHLPVRAVHGPSEQRPGTGATRSSTGMCTAQSVHQHGGANQGYGLSCHYT